MPSILVWTGCFLLVLKGVEILQIGLSSARPARGRDLVVGIGVLSLLACLAVAAAVLVATHGGARWPGR